MKAEKAEVALLWKRPIVCSKCLKILYILISELHKARNNEQRQKSLLSELKKARNTADFVHSLAGTRGAEHVFCFQNIAYFTTFLWSRQGQ